jgi:membrane-associated phospholipid phosphatase
MPVTVRPTRTDKEIARIIARNTTPTMEETAEILTWGADEYVLCAAAAVWWLHCRGRPAPERAASNHILITTIAATILPHLMKHVFTQERPDRRSVRAHLHGTPFSGSPLQAFPSGHAVHVGALASAAAELPSPQRMLAWMAGGGLVLTRVFLLAHWASDVAAGLALGTALERIIRLFTGYGRRRGA